MLTQDIIAMFWMAISIMGVIWFFFRWGYEKRQLKKYADIAFEVQIETSHLNNEANNISLLIPSTEKYGLHVDELKRAIAHLETSLSDIRAEKISTNSLTSQTDSLTRAIAHLERLLADIRAEKISAISADSDVIIKQTIENLNLLTIRLREDNFAIQREAEEKHE